MGKYSITLHTNIVKYLKIILLFISLLFIVLLVTITLQANKEDYINLSFEDAEKIGTNELTAMIKPKLQGIDKKGQAYVITARQATQLSKDSILLEDVHADFTRNNGKWMSLMAKKGFINIKDKQVLAEEDINIFNSDGYEINCSNLQIDLVEGIISSESAVSMQGSNLIFKAKGLYAIEMGKIIDFTGPIHAVLYNINPKKK